MMQMDIGLDAPARQASHLTQVILSIFLHPDEAEFDFIGSRWANHLISESFHGCLALNYWNMA